MARSLRVADCSLRLASHARAAASTNPLENALLLALPAIAQRRGTVFALLAAMMTNLRRCEGKLAAIITGFALFSTACHRSASAEADEAIVGVAPPTSASVGVADGRPAPGEATRARKPNSDGSAVVAPGVRVDGSDVIVEKDGTKVRTGRGGTSVTGTTGGQPTNVRVDGHGTSADVGGVKVRDNEVVVPGVGTVKTD